MNILTIMSLGNLLRWVVITFGTFATLMGFYGLIDPQTSSNAITYVLTLGGRIDETWMGGILAVLLIISLLCSFIPMLKELKKMDRLKEGKITKAKVLDMKVTKFSGKYTTYAKITVETINGQNAGHKASCLLYVYDNNLPKRGEEIEILSDPKNPTIISVIPSQKHAS